MRRALFACLLALASFGGAGCNEYRYYDVEVTFNTTGGQFSVTELGLIQICRVTVSGADSRTFYIMDDPTRLPEQFCPPKTNGSARSRMGVFEYSSHAESGQLTFTMDVWDDITESDGCHHVGSGSVDVPVTGTTTTEGISLVVNKIGDCTP
jgi:hypothetical protein